MKLKLLDLVLCRTPAFSQHDRLEENWEQLKEKIGHSSPKFYKIIESVNAAELNTVDEKTGFTIWKYFNRARYRATPFGGFAAFTTMGVSSDTPQPPIIDRYITAHQLVDWKEIDTYRTDALAIVRSSVLFQTNTSLYTLGNENRYLRVKDGLFEIAAVLGFPELDSILNLCRNKSTGQEIARHMLSDFAMQEEHTTDLLEEMIKLQLLITERFPNITGDDYFIRLGFENHDPAKNYVLSERKLMSGSLDKRKLNDVPNVIKFLRDYLPDPVNVTLGNFRSAFIKKFGDKAIPLALVMDEETGIGYSNLGHRYTGDYLRDILNLPNESNEENFQIPYTALHRFLLEGLIKGEVIRIDDFEETKASSSMQLPNTFNVILRFWNGQLVIENIVGCTANSLLGRFTMASTELLEFGRKIVFIEEKANPASLFFDVAYHGEKHVDNVNRRRQLYNYELPLLTWSCDPSPITLDDLLVAVRGEEIILWSRKHRKRMVPRIPSAYNYNRSDLAVFRFLCDLQHQHLKSELNFRLQHFFPDLKHYPRVTYKEVILSPAMWLVPEELMKLTKTNSPLKMTVLSNWLQKEQINFLFRAGHADQTLCFDPCIERDMYAFLQFCRKSTQQDLYISEAFISKEHGIKDENGKIYAPEFIVSYSHDELIYKYIPSEADITNQADEMIFPGGEWLYFEIYCHPSKSNVLLRKQIPILLKEVSGDILKWFFIRYDDPKPHLRLRFQLCQPDFAYLVIKRLRLLLDDDCMNGIIQDIQIKTYTRATKRYGVDRIHLAESFFCADSKYILYLLKKVRETDEMYNMTLKLMSFLLAHCFKSIADQIIFARRMADAFSEELDLTSDNFKKLNQAFQLRKDDFGVRITIPEAKVLKRHEKLFLDIMSKCVTEAERSKITADLLHMHINRLFDSNQRLHEAVLYHYLLKQLKSRQAQSGFPAEC